MQGETHLELESTQLTLKQRFEENPVLPHGYYVLSDRQTHGKGRQDHLWTSATGNLHVSILLRKFPFQLLTWVPLWLGVALHQTMVQYRVPAEDLQLKWPNDLWINGQMKVAGILCEKIGDEIFAGIGLNLVSAPVPGSGVVPLPVLPDREELVKKLILNLSSFPSVAAIRHYYELHSLFQIGTRLSWSEKSQKMEGDLIGLGEYGELRVRIQDRVVPLYSEEVVAITAPAETGQST